jgi:hypothetical protein
VAVAVGLRTAARSPVTGIEETSVRALAKLEQVLPSRLRRRVSALADYTVPVPPDSPAPAVDPTVLTTLASACRDHERLRFDYRSHDGPRMHHSRDVTPPRPFSRRGRGAGIGVIRDVEGRREAGVMGEPGGVEVGVVDGGSAAGRRTRRCCWRRRTCGCPRCGRRPAR